MPKSKKGKHGGKKKATPPQQRGAPAWAKDLELDDDWDTPKTPFRGFSMRDEARSSGSRFGLQNNNTKYRHQTIAFVSAGANGNATRVERKELVVEAQQAEFAIPDESAEDKLEISEDAMERMNIQSSAGGSGQESDDRDPDVGMKITNGTLHEEAVPDVVNTGTPAFIVDLMGDPTLAPSVKAFGKRPLARKPSPAPSDSSEEIVLFHGRNIPVTITDNIAPQAPRPQTKLPPHIRAAQKSSSSWHRSLPVSESGEPHITDALMDVLEANEQPQRSLTPVQHQTTSSFALRTPSHQKATGWAKWQTWDAQPQEQPAWVPAEPGWWKKNKKQQQEDGDVKETIEQLRKEARKQIKDKKSKKAQHCATDGLNESSGGQAPTVSIPSQANGKAKHKHPTTTAAEDSEELEATLDEILADSRGGRRGKRGRRTQNRRLAGISREVEEAKDEAAYDDYMENLQRQMEENPDNGLETDVSKTVPGGVDENSMVIDGEAIGDNEVLNPHLKIMQESSSDSEGPIGEDYKEAYGSESDDSVDDASEQDSSDLEDELEYTELEQWEDEVDLRQRRMNARTDEQLAMLFAKQEELGIEGDELVIDNGEYASIPDGVGDVDAARAGIGALVSHASSNKHGMRRRRNERDFFPSATLTADVLEQDPYGGFDVMDFDRPSLRPKAKGRKGKLPPELEALSDDEFKLGMAATWSADRDKKRLKKAERQELRTAGLLGTPGHKGKADLSIKYFDGMTLIQVKDEVRTFMDSDLQERAFPPMGKTDRKALHEVCAALGLKSKSQGNGKNRFPIVYKTSLTLEYSDELWQSVMVRKQRGHLKNHFGKSAVKRGNKFTNAANLSKRAGRDGGFSKSAVGYRDGDIVGNGAAELGKENFGHRLMEKMGWTKGMALGKDGEGITVPVTHVVKISKSGLG